MLGIEVGESPAELQKIQFFLVELFPVLQFDAETDHFQDRVSDDSDEQVFFGDVRVLGEIGAQRRKSGNARHGGCQRQRIIPRLDLGNALPNPSPHWIGNAIGEFDVADDSIECLERRRIERKNRGMDVLCPFPRP